MGEAERRLVEAVYADWGHGDYSRSDYLHPDFELVFEPGFLEEGTFQGPTEAWRGWRNWLDQWESWEYDVVRYIDLDDGRIGVFIDITCVARSTGVELRFHTGNLATVADGRLRSVHLYARGEDLLREFGLDA